MSTSERPWALGGRHPNPRYNPDAFARYISMGRPPEADKVPVHLHVLDTWKGDEEAARRSRQRGARATKRAGGRRPGKRRP